EPLGMARTAVAETDALDGVAASYGPRMAMRTALGLEQGSRPDYSCLAGAGAFLSTPMDLVRFGSAMLTPGPLKKETIALFQTPTRLVSGASTTYALGWTVGNVPLAGEPARKIS